MVLEILRSAPKTLVQYCVVTPTEGGLTASCGLSLEDAARAVRESGDKPVCVIEVKPTGVEALCGEEARRIKP